MKKKSTEWIEKKRFLKIQNKNALINSEFLWDKEVTESPEAGKPTEKRKRKRETERERESARAE